MNSEEKLYSIALSIISSPAHNKIWDYIYTSHPSEIYNRIEGKNKLRVQGFISAKYKGEPFEAARAIYDHAISQSIKMIDFWDRDYPPLLKEINKPPLLLYYKGHLNTSRSLAIVGTRNNDKKSSQVTRRISSELSKLGFTIISGMAIGIDREAHLGALQSNGSTIGVLANGIGIIYPSFNRDLYTAILSTDNSSLVSEYPPDVFAGKWTFVRRNRIISGLSLGTIVIKAGMNSGALITSRYAIEQNREVFACPGLAFDEEYSGCHNLIKNGAVLVSSTEDILRELPISNDIQTSLNALEFENRSEDISNRKVFVDENNLKGEFKEDSIERKILNLLTDGDKDMDSVVRLIDCNTSEANKAILMLELSGEITRDGNRISKS
ncbi:MAG: DNA-processing protein DprA [Spirochaetota bacterium]|nr:DNA-processing protein DprA [Spirochaetota bacterium]